MTSISWFSGLYLEDYFMYKAVTLAGGIREPLLTCSSILHYLTNISAVIFDRLIRATTFPPKIEFSVPCVMVRGYISRLGKLMKKIERLCVRTAGRVETLLNKNTCTSAQQAHNVEMTSY